MQRQLTRLLAPLQRRIRQIATRAMIEAIDTETALVALRAKISDTEVLEGLEYFEPYGLTTSPPQNSEAIVLSLGGRREHSVVVQVANREYRPAGLESGDVAIYNRNGDKIVLRDNGETELEVSTKVTMTCPDFVINGEVEINGNITHDGNQSSTGNHSIGGNASVEGRVDVGGAIQAGGDIRSGPISLTSHTHSGVKSGTSSTGLPK